MQAELWRRRLVGRWGATCSGAAARASPRGSSVFCGRDWTASRAERSAGAGEMQCADGIPYLAPWLTCLVRRYPGLRTEDSGGIQAQKYMWTSRGDGGDGDGREGVRRASHERAGRYNRW